jgi:DNA-binding MarR family transcriptional regulator
VSSSSAVGDASADLAPADPAAAAASIDPAAADLASADTAATAVEDTAEEAVEEAQTLLSGVALTVFRLNGQVLAVAEELARPADLTAAWWQVLGAVLREPLPVAGIGRVMGITRQSVQRIADLLVERGLAEYLPNPAHRRAKLVRPTAEGYEAIRRINPGHAELAGRLVGEMGREDLRVALDALTRLSAAFAAVADAPDDHAADGPDAPAAAGG